jgi:uncharacterized spore protein YtfJ
MNVHELVTTARDALIATRVFGEPVERDGVTVIPAAILRGGVGGGTGKDERGQQGEGGGFGLVARPAGAYIIRDGKVTWRPAFDVNRTIGLTGTLAIAWLFTRGRRPTRGPDQSPKLTQRRRP